MAAIVKNGFTACLVSPHHEQVKAARPTADYDTRHGATSWPWTIEMFVEAMCRDLSRRN
jgi:hypothetical protein